MVEILGWFGVCCFQFCLVEKKGRPLTGVRLCRFAHRAACMRLMNGFIS